MADNEAKVSIVADASGVQPGVDVAKGEVASLGPVLQQLNANFAELASQIRASMAQGGTATGEMAQEMRHLEEETERETLSLREMGSRMKETALSVHEGVESFNRFRGAIREAIEAYAVFFGVERVKEWATEMGEAAEKVEHVHQQLGLSTTQVQQLQGVAIGTGVSFDTLTRGMMLLDRNLERKPQLFHQMGIAATASSGQMDILLATADRFKNMAPGPEKVAAAMQLMGRNGAAMIPILDRGAAGLQELMEKAQAYGEVNAQAVTAGFALAESVNESKMAWDGLKQTLTQEFAPLLQQIVDGFNNMVVAMTASYQSGGMVKQVFDAIVTVVEGFGEIFRSVGDACAEIFRLMGFSAGQWGTAFQTVIELAVVGTKVFIWAAAAMVAEVGYGWDKMKADILGWYADWVDTFERAGLRIDEFKIILHSLGAVIEDVFTLHWDSIAADWDAGMSHLADVVKTRSAAIASSVAALRDSAKAASAASDEVKSGFANWSAGFFQTHAGPTKTGEPDEGDGGGEPPPSSAHQKKPKDESQMGGWEEQLAEAKLAYEQQQDAAGTFHKWGESENERFWGNILATDAMSAKDRISVETKYYDAKSAVGEQAFQGQIANLQKQLEAAKGNGALQIQIAEEIATKVGNAYGQESKQAQAAQEQVIKVRREAAQQAEQLNTEIADGAKRLALAEIDSAESAAKFRQQMGLTTESQLLQQQKAFEDRRYQIEDQALQQRLALMAKDPFHNVVEYQKILDAIAVLERQHQAKLTTIDQQAILQRTAVERTAINSTAQLWSQNVAKLLILQQGFAATVRSLYTGMVDVISTALASVIEKWLEQQLSAFLLKRAAQSADGAASVTSNAGIAAAAAFASTAAIPIVGPELAPEAAAAAFSATMAFAPIASAAGGWWQIDRDQVAQVHQNEMVLPASLASPLRSLITGYRAANLNAPVAANEGSLGGGDTFHIHAVDATSFKKLLLDHAPVVGEAVRRHVRMGGKTTMN